MFKITIEPVTDSTAEAAEAHREVVLTDAGAALLLDAAYVGIEGADTEDDAVLEQAAAAILRLQEGLR